MSVPTERELTFCILKKLSSLYIGPVHVLFLECQVELVLDINLGKWLHDLQIVEISIRCRILRHLI